jgi:hypothetical protein
MVSHGPKAKVVTGTPSKTPALHHKHRGNSVEHRHMHSLLRHSYLHARGLNLDEAPFDVSLLLLGSGFFRRGSGQDFWRPNSKLNKASSFIFRNYGAGKTVTFQPLFLLCIGYAEAASILPYGFDKKLSHAVGSASCAIDVNLH